DFLHCHKVSDMRFLTSRQSEKNPPMYAIFLISFSSTLSSCHVLQNLLCRLTCICAANIAAYIIKTDCYTIRAFLISQPTCGPHSIEVRRIAFLVSLLCGSGFCRKPIHSKICSRSIRSYSEHHLLYPIGCHFTAYFIRFSAQAVSHIIIWRSRSFLYHH